MQAGGHEFDSRILHLAAEAAENLIRYSSLAQSVEHSAVNRSVVGSSPTGGAHKARKFKQRARRTCLHVHLAVLCAGGTRLAPTEVERRPAARVKDHRGI